MKEYTLIDDQLPPEGEEVLLKNKEDYTLLAVYDGSYFYFCKYMQQFTKRLIPSDFEPIKWKLL